MPISRLTECLLQTREDIRDSGITAPIVGHVGDGNFHCLLLYDERDPEMVRRVVALNERIVARALALGGTCTGEHGVGLGKMRHLAEEQGPGAIRVMKSLKATLDPQNLLNPGKLFL